MACTSCKSVFITGCNRGIGLEFVKQFLNIQSPPKFIFATCRQLAAENANDLKQLASENKNLHLIPLDVDDYEGIRRAASEVGEKLQGQGLDILINNAGIIDRKNLETVTAEALIQVYKTNAVSPLMLTQAFLPLLKKAAVESNGKAIVLNISSLFGSIEENTFGGNYAYCASKSALNAINKSLSVDLKSFGIVSVVIHPGWVKTDMGGENALISTAESVSGIMGILVSLDESKSGTFLDYNGKTIPW